MHKISGRSGRGNSMSITVEGRARALAKAKEMLDDGLTEIIIADPTHKEWTLEEFAVAAVEHPGEDEPEK